jgi:DNA polymerase-3 subunit delta'
MPLLPLIGHTSLRARLDDQIVRGRLPGSLLLQGPPGVGKQRLALWLGQRLLCTGEAPPCGECQHCKYALEGVHPDLRWYFPRPRIKDSSDIALDDVAREYAEAIAERVAANGIYARADGSHGIFVYVSRLIVQQAVKTPAMATRKVFVVGEAERMVPQAASQEAANAFLKLLEEPPADTTIILTSSEPGALLPTIRSRVVSIRVAPLPDADVRAFLAHPVAADAAGKGATMDELVRLAHGAPGTLIGAADRRVALDRARSMLAAARGGREKLLRAAFGQGSSKARGAFSDVLEAMTVLLHESARDATAAGDAPRAVAAAKAIHLVEEAKRAAEGNAVPQLVSAHLLSELAEIGA